MRRRQRCGRFSGLCKVGVFHFFKFLVSTLPSASATKWLQTVRVQAVSYVARRSYSSHVATFSCWYTDTPQVSSLSEPSTDQDRCATWTLRQRLSRSGLDSLAPSHVLIRPEAMLAWFTASIPTWPFTRLRPHVRIRLIITSNVDSVHRAAHM